MKARLFTDGGARGNPGPAAYGFVLEDADATVLAAHGEAIGVATNNVAEYRALLAGLERAAELGDRRALGVDEHDRRDHVISASPRPLRAGRSFVHAYRLFTSMSCSADLT